ncbi:hypothetical protein PV10_02873 [Exophiala mesophila]|uniref:Uncharacterized protein n=1 Tax=Exophiala mesophila TaxID=212818 RepID=A0A0D2A884_EXOME|nr:uncharacterized protein PV10_02873 [Exophiala mesophila]KIV95193.1 hypothetical protein PV10_02873 [Exophiala mesophila]
MAQPNEKTYNGADAPMQQPMGAPHQHNGGAAAVAYPQNHNHGSRGANGAWSFGLFDCFSPFGTCCLSCWCPCILYGKNQDIERGDPDSSGCNGSCLAWYCLSCFGVSCILQCINRTSLREKYGIEGGSCGDFCTSCCCTCCALIQENKEVKVRTTGIDPTTEKPYASPSQMAYP